MDDMDDTGVCDRLSFFNRPFKQIYRGVPGLKTRLRMHAFECHGCRGAAAQVTGDYLASDPTCRRNSSYHNL